MAKVEEGGSMGTKTIIIAAEELMLPEMRAVGGFDAMKRDLDAEKAAMPRIWAKREKQLQRLETGMLNVVGALQVIGQGAVGQLDLIADLPREDDSALGHAMLVEGR